MGKRIEVYALVLTSLLITISTTFFSVYGQTYLFDLSDCSVRTDKDSYQVGETITIYVYIGKRIPDEVVSSYFLQVTNPEHATSEVDLGFLSRDSYNKTIVAEPPAGQVSIQLRLRPKPNVDVSGQIGNPTYSFEVTESQATQSTQGVVLLLAVAVIAVIIILVLYTRGKRPRAERKRGKRR